MAVRFSTAAANRLLTYLQFGPTISTGTLLSMLGYGVIELRTGSQPVSADDAATGTLLGTVTVNGAAFTPGATTNGLLFGTAANGILAKSGSQVWQYTALATGDLGWFRFKGNVADAGAADASAAYVRIDGSVGMVGADYTPTYGIRVNVGDVHTISAFTISLAKLLSGS